MKKDYPPYLYVVQIAEHCPRAIGTYLSLWRNRDKNFNVYIDKDTLKTDYLISKTKFKNDLVCLLKEALINIDEDKHGFKIELVAWQKDE